MHHTRLVGGLISLAALLTLLLVPSAIIAASGPSRAPSGTPTPSPPTASPGSGGDPPASAATPRRPRLTRAQRRERRLARQRLKVMRIARGLRGVPYVYGGASRSGFDCSGFTMYVYKRLGFSLSHGATGQARRGARVSLRYLRPGDLVFYGGSGYYSHVAIYAGRGRIIAAPHTGAVVSYSPLRGAATARRLIGF
jgi:cell wall-associated NlpC family hydrolase